MKRTTKTCLTCPGGPRELALDQFGVDRAQFDKHNTRCKQCVARRTAERRAAVKAGQPFMRRRRGRPPASESFVPRRTGLDQLAQLAPVVLSAIDQAGGVCSQGEIVKFARARLPSRLPGHVVQDFVGHALGELFAERAIATRGEAEERIYFRRESFVMRRW